MSRSSRWSLLCLAASLLCAGCSGSSVPVPPQPSSSPAPPIVLGRGTLAVAERSPAITRVLIFPPHSDKPVREIPFHGEQLDVNSLAFDRRGHLYVGVNDTSRGGHYHAVEFNLRDFTVVRDISVPQWSRSSVAIDGDNVLYVNTKALVGGDIKIFSRGERTPSLEIKDHRSPVTILVASNSLWVGYEGALADALARYQLRSTDRTWLQTVGANLPVKLAVNPEGSLIAAKLWRNSKGTIDVTDVKSGKRAQILNGSGVEAMVSDDSGNLYIGELPGTIHRCTFQGCTNTFDTKSRIVALAVSPLDGMLYVASSGKPSIQVYNPRTGNQVMYIPIAGGYPKRLAVEP